jgi:cytochrome c-type biogenesis protein CcmH/NrfG
MMPMVALLLVSNSEMYVVMIMVVTMNLPIILLPLYQRVAIEDQTHERHELW